MKLSLVRRSMPRLAAALSLVTHPAASIGPARQPLRSWGSGAARTAIIQFVSSVTDASAPTFVRPEERIAVFDHDGTLWAEMPLPAQAVFAFDRVRALTPEHPEWRTQEPFRAVLDNDHPALGAMTKHDVLALMSATHAGMTTTEFDATVKAWLATAKHPKFGRLYTQCVYQPMIELLSYLRDNGFSTYIVSGGGVEFVRTFSEGTYGILPNQVIGSSAKTRFEIRDGAPVFVKLPELGSFDDQAEKPVNINLHVGRKPTLAVGNSDGDFQMLEYAAAGPGPHLSMLVHHDDREREFAYDRTARSWGRLNAALDAAHAQGWTVVSMKADWTTIFGG